MRGQCTTYAQALIQYDRDDYHDALLIDTMMLMQVTSFVVTDRGPKHRKYRKYMQHNADIRYWQGLGAVKNATEGR